MKNNIYFKSIKYKIKSTNSKIILICSIIVLTTSVFSGCISIKSKYIPANIYTIPQSKIDSSIDKNVIPKNIFIKSINIPNELETNKIAIIENNKLSYYNYNRWILQLDDLLTEFINSRFNMYNSFKKGINNSIFTNTPDLILECNITKCIINKSDNNTIEINMLASLSEYNNNKKQYEIIFSKTYNKQKQLNVFSVENYSIYMGTMMSEIIDDIIKNILGIFL